jgi:ABC-type multidrug transport system fused ATPase/permease subunit
MAKRNPIKKLWSNIQGVQRFIDLTPHLLKFIDKFKQKKKVSIFMFFLLLIVGFTGLLLPIIQGWLIIVVAFGFLGIKPIDNFLKSNKKAMLNISTILVLFFVGNFTLWAGSTVLPYDFPSPIDNALKVIQFGQPTLEEVNQQVFSLVGLEYDNVQTQLSIVDWTENEGFSIVG